MIGIGICGKERGEEVGFVVANGVDERGVAVGAYFFDGCSFGEEVLDGGDVVVLNGKPEAAVHVLNTRQEQFERGAKVICERDLNGALAVAACEFGVGPGDE